MPRGIPNVKQDEITTSESARFVADASGEITDTAPEKAPEPRVDSPRNVVFLNVHGGSVQETIQEYAPDYRVSILNQSSRDNSFTIVLERVDA